MRRATSSSNGRRLGIRVSPVSRLVQLSTTNNAERKEAIVGDVAANCQWYCDTNPGGQPATWPNFHLASTNRDGRSEGTLDPAGWKDLAHAADESAAAFDTAFSAKWPTFVGYLTSSEKSAYRVGCQRLALL